MNSRPLANSEVIDGSLLEGLFQRQLQPQGAFAEELRSLGYDADFQKPSYDRRLAVSFIACARRNAFPHLNDADAYRALASVFIKGYFNTIIGRLTGVVIPIIGPAKTLGRAQKLWTRGDPAMLIRSAQVEAKRWRLDYENCVWHPEYVAGIIEAAVKLAAPNVSVNVLEGDGTTGVLSAQWM